jgi:aminopeptidase YwaD
MKMKTPRSLRPALALLAFAPFAQAQEAEDRTLLSWKQMRAIIDEASGERAMHHVLELVPYQRVRPLSEYKADGHFRESEVMARFAREYGYSSVEIESFPSPGALYQPTRGQLFMVSPKPRKLFDIYDTPVALANNSASGDVTADVVDVGNGGRAEDYAGKDVKGKIVLGFAGTNALQRLAVFERGALGVLAYSLMRADDQPDEFISSSVSATVPEGASTGFGWSISARAAREMQTALLSGQKVTLRSVVEAQTFPGRQEVIHATIQGDGSTQQDVVVSAHVYEGLIKQGANDDNSGAAMTLEMGRAYIELVKQGLLPKPRRTIHFLWVQEISGTNAWLNAHKDIEKRVIADLNYDMEGLRLTTSGATWLLMRTPDSFPSFLNDVAQNFLEYVAEISRERVRYRANGYAPVDPVISANGRRLHGPWHPRRHLQYLAGLLVSLEPGHAGQARLHHAEAGRGGEHRRHGRARGRGRPHGPQGGRGCARARRGAHGREPAKGTWASRRHLRRRSTGPGLQGRQGDGPPPGERGEGGGEIERGAVREPRGGNEGALRI